MTEQEFRELTAYQPPTQPKHSPPVSSIAAAVAAGKAPNGAAPQTPEVEAPTPPAQSADSLLTPPIPAAPEPVEFSAPNQFISQIHAQPAPPPPPPAPVQVSAPVQASEPVQVSGAIRESSPEPRKSASDMVPVEKHNELMEQYTRLNERYKRIVEERDALSRQVTDLKHSAAERGDTAVAGRDYKEEIRLLGKLIDDEQSLRKSAAESGARKPGEDPYVRHDKLVNVFLNIVGRME